MTLLLEQKEWVRTPLGAMVHTGRAMAGPILEAFVESVRSRGWRVCGLLQSADTDPSAPQSQTESRHMELVDIALGKRYVISQNLGPGSVSCSLSAEGVAVASEVLRRSLCENPDLLVVNRFGKLEAQGLGLRQEMALAVQAGIPVLTAVSSTFLPQWRAFTGGLAQELSPTLEALEEWWQSQLTEPPGGFAAVPGPARCTGPAITNLATD